ncbi:MAG TPA: caspase family protein, partial [Spirochaetota bacterium]|nr:caspase family protein [Spirochaetota bacterium]
MRGMIRCAGAVMLLAAAVCFLPSAARSATIHAILVGDTVDPNIGRGDKLDLDLMTGLLRDASKQTGMRLNMRVFDDRIVRSQIMSAVQALRPESNDTVVFFYTGHGYRTSSFRDKWPAFALKNESGGSAGLDQKWVYNELKDKGARLLIVMADACNSVVPDGAIDTRMALRSGKELPESYRKLFLEARGTILASSSIPGQYSYSGSNGSQFTVAFIESVRKALAGANPSWEPIMREATRPLYGGQQQPQFAMNDAAGTPGEAERDSSA